MKYEDYTCIVDSGYVHNNRETLTMVSGKVQAMSKYQTCVLFTSCLFLVLHMTAVYRRHLIFCLAILSTRLTLTVVYKSTIASPSDFKVTKQLQAYKTIRTMVVVKQCDLYF